MEQKQTERGAAFLACPQSHLTPRTFGQDVRPPGQALGFTPLSQ